MDSMIPKYKLKFLAYVTPETQYGKGGNITPLVGWEALLLTKYQQSVRWL